MSRSVWTRAEIGILIDNYSSKTTDELMALLPRKSRKAVNRQIEELRSAGLIEYRDKRTVNRAYRQRSRTNRPESGGGRKLPQPKPRGED